MTWIKLWNRKHSVQHNYFGRQIYLMNNPYYRLRNTITISTGKGKADFYADEREWRRLMVRLAREAEHPDYLAYTLARFRRDRAFIRHVARRLANPTRLRRMHPSEMLRRYRLLECAHLRYTYFFWTPWALNQITVPRFERQLRRRFPGDATALFTAITSPSRSSTMDRLIDALLEAKARGRLRRDLPRLAARYAWLRVYSLNDQPFTHAQLAALIGHARNPKLELLDRRARRRRNRRQFRTALEQLRPFPGLARTANILHLFAWLRTERVDVWRKILWQIQPFYRELERRIGLSRGLGPQLTYPEVVEFLRFGRPPRNVRPNVLMYLHEGQLDLIRDPVVARRIVRRLIRATPTSARSLTGMIANPGRARGRVRIVMVPEDCRTVRRGDILVSNMTHPDYLPGMVRAAAIVTDEGGISSHAAIVARELNKPCIIGTKIATQVFKDGDVVEVDADRGIVRRVVA